MSVVGLASFRFLEIFLNLEICCQQNQSFLFFECFGGLRIIEKRSWRLLKLFVISLICTKYATSTVALYLCLNYNDNQKATRHDSARAKGSCEGWGLATFAYARILFESTQQQRIM